MIQPLGLYVHVPFCEAKCTYCHFAIDPRRPDAARQDRYVAALLAEVSAAPPARADTLYFGGGTPSLLSGDRLARVVGAVRDRFALDADAEVTLEANPKDLDLDGYRGLREIGVDRLSLGVQSLDDTVLREMGRLHGAADAREAVERARRAGFRSTSVDLILGWPGETRERWRKSLEGVAALGPDHVSLYVLEVEGKTLLSHRSRRGQLTLPEDDLVADLYRATVERLDALGIRRYEISNFARPGHESRHNAKYWDDAPFLGFGMSAHSYLGGRRFWNLASYGEYVAAFEGSRPGGALAGERVLSPSERRQEALFTGLRRREGVSLEGFRERYGVEPIEEHGAALRDCFEAGLLEVAAGALRLTDRGLLVSNEVFQRLV